MAPRKAAKHPDSEVVDRAAEAGDISPPKRKKTVSKVTTKNNEEKQIRLPRAAKSAKTEQTEVPDTTSVATKNTKAKNKILQPPKNALPAVKTNTKVKSTAAKKNKETEEKSDVTSSNVEATTNVEEAETKRTRTKATTKKAGTDVDEERTFLRFLKSINNIVYFP